MFVSYRQSDGTVTMTDLSWLLRAAGLPVWHDRTDLPPGDTEQRLDEALAAGLGGAVLLVTPDLVHSGVVRNVELPRLRDLARDPGFVFAVANAVLKSDGSVDYGAPDRLLSQPPRTLGSLKQYGAGNRAGLVDLTREMLAFRAGQLAEARRADAGPLHVQVQTRGGPQQPVPGGPDLSVVLRPGSGGRLPSPEGLRDLRDALPLLPGALARIGRPSVRLTGGAHLSVAFALGAALPTTLVGRMTVEGSDGQPWTCGTVSGAADGLVHRAGHGMNSLGAVGRPRHVVAFVELLPDTSAAAYTRFLGEHDGFDAWEHLRPEAPGRLDPTTAAPLIEDVAARLRDLAQTHDNATLHLLLRCPFPVAVLLGRLCNTLRTVVYEWDDEVATGDPDHRPRYVAALAIRAGHTDGPITEVLLPPAPTVRTAP